MNIFKPVELNPNFDTVHALAGINDLAREVNGVVYSASSFAVGYEPQHAFRSSAIGSSTTPGTCWKANTGGTQTLTCTFPTTVEISQIFIVGVQNSTEMSKIEPPLRYDSQYSGGGFTNLEVEIFNGIWVNFATYTNVASQCLLTEPVVAASGTAVRITITGSHLINPSIAALRIYGKPPAWESNRNYTVGNVISFGNNVYSSVYSANFNFNPESLQGKKYWQKTGLQNRFNFLDGSLGNPTYLWARRGLSPGQDSVSFTSVTKFDTLAILGAQIGSVYLRVSKEVTSFNSANSITSSTVTDIIERTKVFTQPTFPFDARQFSCIFEDLVDSTAGNTPIGGTYSVWDSPGGNRTETVYRISLSFTGVASSMSLNFVDCIVAGLKLNLGLTQYGASSSITDYSVKSTDDYGNVTLIKRAFAKNMKVSVEVPQEDIARVQKDLQTYRATPLVWYANTDDHYEEALIIYGFYKDLTLNIPYPTYSLLELNVEALAQNT